MLETVRYWGMGSSFGDVSGKRWELWELQTPTFRDDSPLAIRDTSSTLVT